MPASKVNVRAAELMERLSPKGRRSALEYIQFLAEREDVVPPEDAAEDRALVERVRAGDLSGTVTLEEARKQVLGGHGRTAHV